MLFLATAGCGVEPGGGDGGDAGTFDSGPYAFVVTTDYTTGSFATVEISSRQATKNLCNGHLCSIFSDAIARRHRDQIYIVNRLGQDNIQILDPVHSFTTVNQYSVGAGSNPQDIAFANGKGYITRQEMNNVLVVKPETGERIAEIDLSQFSDPDGNCEPALMASDGQYVYVAILRLNRTQKYVPSGKSYVAVIDSATDRLVGNGILLNTTNPYAGFFLDGSNLYVGCAGSFQVLDGAIELIDTTTLKNKGVIVDEQTLGGDINFFTIKNNVIYATISDQNFSTAIKTYDISTRFMGQIVKTTGFDLAGIAINSLEELYVADRSTTNPGIRIFGAIGGREYTPTPINTGLPPLQIMFME
jgi:DNA-binding beta-propeller fold protein YncE